VRKCDPPWPSNHACRKPATQTFRGAAMRVLVCYVHARDMFGIVHCCLLGNGLRVSELLVMVVAAKGTSVCHVRAPAIIIHAADACWRMMRTNALCAYAPPARKLYKTLEGALVMRCFTTNGALRRRAAMQRRAPCLLKYASTCAQHARGAF